MNEGAFPEGPLGHVRVRAAEPADLPAIFDIYNHEVLNSTAYGLSSSIYTQDVARAFRAMRDIEAGITYVNGPTIGAEVHLPFGGVKNTGNGHREAGTTVYDIFTEWKSIYVDYSGKLQRAQIDNAE